MYKFLNFCALAAVIGLGLGLFVGNAAAQSSIAEARNGGYFPGFDTQNSGLLRFFTRPEPAAPAPAAAAPAPAPAPAPAADDDAPENPLPALRAQVPVWNFPNNPTPSLFDVSPQQRLGARFPSLRNRF